MIGDVMNDSGSKEDWIKGLTDTSDQLKRLADQLEEMKNPKFVGVIGRINDTHDKLDAIKDWLEKLPDHLF